MTLVVVFLFTVLLVVAVVILIATGKGRVWRGAVSAFLGLLAGVGATLFCVQLRSALVKTDKNPQVAGQSESGGASSQKSGFGKTLADWFSDSGTSRRKGPDGTLKRLDDLNATIQLADGPWSEMDPSLFKSDACFMARNVRKRLLASMVIERIDTPMTSGNLAEIVKSNVEGAGEILEWRMMEPATLDDVPSLCAGYVLRLSGKRISYVNLLHVDHGYVRQFIVGSEKGMPLEDLRKEALEISKGFHRIDRNRKAAAALSELPPGKFAEWGCEVQAGGPGWGKATEPIRGAIWHGTRGGTIYLVVVPVALEGLEPDAPALVRGLLSGATGRALPDSGVTEKPVAIPGAQAVDYEYQDKPDGGAEFHRIVRVIRRGDQAWLLDGGCFAGSPARLEELRGFLDEFRIDPAAPAVLPKNPEDFHAMFCNQAGLSYYTRRNYPEAARFFEKAATIDPGKTVYFQNVFDSLIESGNPEAAVDRYETLPEDLRKDAGLMERQARACASLGRVADARDTYKRLFGSGHRDDAVLQSAVDFLLQNNEKAEALALSEAYRKNGVNQGLDRLHSRVLIRNGKSEDALALLQKLHESAPANLPILIDLADVLGVLKRQDEAIRLLHEALAADAKNPLLLYNLGYQLASAEKFEEAVEVLESAVTASPRDETIQEELAYVRSRLGRGHDREVRRPLDPVPLPSSLEAPAVWDASRLASDADRYHLLQATVYDYKPGEPFGRTEYADVMVITERAVESFSTLRFSFNPLNERVYVNRVEVLDASGKVVAEGKQKDQYVTDEEGSEATATKVLCVPVPGLTGGSRLRYSITYRDRSPSGEFTFNPHFFVTRYGSRLSAICVRGGKESYASLTRGEIRERSEEGVRIWSVADLPALPNDARLPQLESFTPVLWLGPAGKDWKKTGDEYLKEMAAQLKADPDIESMARDLVAEAKDEEAKIRILYRWIQNEFTYKAIEFGSRARIPHASSVTCSNRYGDCKDLSVLLHSMLRAAGVESNLCLVHTANVIAPEIPSLDQFNHMIVHLPAKGKRPAAWIDPTARQHALVMTVSPWLEGLRTFVLADGASRFETVPHLGYPSPHRVKVERSLAAGKDGALQMEETLSLDGYAADSFRSYLVSNPAAERLQRLREWIAGIDSAITLDTVEIANLKEQDKPLQLKLTSTATGCLDAAGRLKRIPFSWESNYLKPLPQSQRVSPFSVIPAWSVESRTTGSVLPSGDIKPGNGSDPSWGEWRLESTGKAPQWSIAYHGRFRRGDLFPAKDYQSFFDFWDRGVNLLAKPWDEKGP